MKYFTLLLILSKVILSIEFGYGYSWGLISGTSPQNIYVLNSISGNYETYPYPSGKKELQNDELNGILYIDRFRFTLGTSILGIMEDKQVFSSGFGLRIKRNLHSNLYLGFESIQNDYIYSFDNEALPSLTLNYVRDSGLGMYYKHSGEFSSIGFSYSKMNFSNVKKISTLVIENIEKDKEIRNETKPVISNESKQQIIPIVNLDKELSTLINKEKQQKIDNKKWAVIIGIENYRKTVSVEFATSDASFVKEYFEKLLGIPKENIFLLTDNDATYGEVQFLVKDILKNRIVANDEVYFYFSGHGISVNNGDSYLLLNDSNPSNPILTAYKVEDLYKDLGKLKTNNSYVFLDTCFSGGVSRGTEKEALLEGSRAGLLKVNDITLAYPNLIVFNSSDLNQLSNSYKEKEAGLFTYYLLKGLIGEGDINKDKKLVTAQALKK